MHSSNTAALPELAHKLMETGYHALLKYEHQEWGEGYSIITMNVTPSHLNLGGVLHGGVLTGLLDIVCAQAGIYFPDENLSRRSVTLSLTTTFTAQCSEGIVTACGKVRARGRRIYSASGEVKDQHGNLLAFGEGTFRYRSQ